MSKTIEERVEKLESELEALKAEKLKNGKGGDWLDTIIGSFENDPEFDEIVRLGKEFRHEDRPRDTE